MNIFKTGSIMKILIIFLSLIFITINCFEYDSNGYVIFCLCMGRFGNQADHFLGSMSFAKSLNRTLVVPPFRTYKNVPFDEWFKFDELKKFHRVISADDFMSSIAPVSWPKQNRTGFCWSYDKSQDCKMKDGNPMGNFWTELGVDDFPLSINFVLGFSEFDQWKNKYPGDKYPVLAFRGAPASYPVKREDRENQKYFTWSDKIENESAELIKKYFQDKKYVGIHLRNGIDWSNVCRDVEGYDHYMSSPQCLEDTGHKVTKDICFPSKSSILQKLDKILIERLNRTVRDVYIATDKDPMINEIRDYFIEKDLELNLVHHDPWLPIIDLAVLGKSEYFIGNCVSSFTAFVVRERNLKEKKSEFWSFDL